MVHEKYLEGENIKLSAKERAGYFELKKHRPQFDQTCTELVDKKKEAKLQWLQNPSEINVDNQKIVRCEANRYFRNKKKTKAMNELATNSNDKKNRRHV
jgi:hypothetical protein